MTDQQPPPDPIAPAVEALAEQIRETWTAIRPVLRALDNDQADDDRLPTGPADRIDFGALNAAIADALADALERWHEPGVAYDPAGQLAAVRSAVDPFLHDLLDRADGRVAWVERQRAAWEADAKRHLGNAEYWRQRAEQAEELLGALDQEAGQ